MNRLVETVHTVIAVANETATSLSEDAVNLSNYARCLIEIVLSISSGTASGAVTVKQATDNAAGSEKALSFSEYWYNHTVSANDILTRSVASSNTFNAGGAAETRHYFIDVLAADLDQANDFDHIRVDLADVTNGTATMLYHLYKARHGGSISQFPAAL